MKLKELIFSIIFMIILTLVSKPAAAQQEEKAAEENAGKLQQKLLLSDEQKARLAEILLDYIEDPDEDNLNSAKEKTETLLNEKQKVKYDIIKKDWWDSLKKEAKSIRQE